MRPAPAESPIIWIFWGCTPLARRCSRASIACLSWIGKGPLGTSAAEAMS